MILRRHRPPRALQTPAWEGFESIGLHTPGGILVAMETAWQALRNWNARRWWAALGAGIVTALIVAVPTAVIPTPIFGRSIEPTWWSYPVVLLTGLLGGLVFATYVRTENSSHAPPPSDANASDPADRPTKVAMAGGFLAYLAVGCPVCNKLVLVALGASGAVTWFAPVQGLLALASLLMLTWALIVRLRGEVACPVSLVDN